MTINIKLDGSRLCVIDPQPILADGTVKKAKFRLTVDADWDGLAITVVFRRVFALGAESRAVVIGDLSADYDVPHEVLHDGWLYIGAIGVADNGDVRLTTAQMDKPLRVFASESDAAESSVIFTPSAAEQILSLIGAVSNLDTNDKSSIVAAINEVLNSMPTDGSEINTQVPSIAYGGSVTGALNAIVKLIGAVSNLGTKNKSSIVEAINEVLGGIPTDYVKSVNNVRPRANGDLLLDASDIDTQLPSISYQGGVDGALKAILSMPALPIARGTSADGIAYTETDDVSGTVLPTVSTANNDEQISAVGKGRQIVFIPWLENESDAPTLQLNGGEVIPIRLRAPKNQGSSDQSPDATLPVPAGALMRGVPYTLTFCGKYWLIDSQVTQFTNSIAEALTKYANRLIGLSDSDTIAVPIINSMDGVSDDMATMFVTRSAEENKNPNENGDVTVPTVEKVSELIATAIGDVDTAIAALDSVIGGDHA